MSLQAADSEAGKHAVAPRVSLADIEAAIERRFHITGEEALGMVVKRDSPLAVLSICILVMRNGFTVIGKSAPASAANFNRELGQKLAYEDAVRQLWPLMGFALRDRLAGF